MRGDQGSGRARGIGDGDAARRREARGRTGTAHPALILKRAAGFAQRRPLSDGAMGQGVARATRRAARARTGP